MKPTILYPADQLAARSITVAEIARELYPDMQFDTALPQEWVDACSFDPRGQVVWGYPSGTLRGCPLPLTREALIHLCLRVR